MKQRKCMNCATLFTPDRMGQKTCSPRCAYQSVQVAKDKAFNAVTRTKKKEWRDNDKHTQAELAKKACHAYVRERDKLLPCKSCGSPADQCQRHAGHYRPSGINSALRYDDRNIFGQCVRCNLNLSGNLVEFRKSLIASHGQELVDWLDNNHETKRWTIDELKSIQAHYKAKLRGLKNGS